MVYICIECDLRGRLHELKGARLPVLMAIALHTDGRTSWPTFDAIMRETGLARATVAKAIADLESGRWISVEREHRKVSVYRLLTSQIHMNGNSSKTELNTNSRVQKLNSTGSITELNVVQKLNSTGSETELQEDTIEEDTIEEESKKKNSPHSREFVEFWRVYPRKDGKQAAWRKWESRRKERITAAAMTVAAVNYAAYCTAVGTEERFVKHASTFLGPDRHWEEWQEPKAVPKNGKRDIGREAEFDEARRILGLEATG